MAPRDRASSPRAAAARCLRAEPARQSGRDQAQRERAGQQSHVRSEEAEEKRTRTLREIMPGGKRKSAGSIAFVLDLAMAAASGSFADLRLLVGRVEVGRCRHSRGGSNRTPAPSGRSRPRARTRCRATSRRTPRGHRRSLDCAPGIDRKPHRRAEQRQQWHDNEKLAHLSIWERGMVTRQPGYFG